MKLLFLSLIFLLLLKVFLPLCLHLLVLFFGILLLLFIPRSSFSLFFLSPHSRLGSISFLGLTGYPLFFFLFPSPLLCPLFLCVPLETLLSLPLFFLLFLSHSLHLKCHLLTDLLLGYPFLMLFAEPFLFCVLGAKVCLLLLGLLSQLPHCLLVIDLALAEFILHFGLFLAAFFLFAEPSLVFLNLSCLFFIPFLLLLNVLLHFLQLRLIPGFSFFPNLPNPLILASPLFLLSFPSFLSKLHLSHGLLPHSFHLFLIVIFLGIALRISDFIAVSFSGIVLRLC